MAKRKAKSSGRRRASARRGSRRGFGGAVRRGFAFMPPNALEQVVAAAVGGAAAYLLPVKLFGKMEWFKNPANKWTGPVSQGIIAAGGYMLVKKFAPKYANAMFLGAASVPVGQFIIEQVKKNTGGGVSGIEPDFTAGQLTQGNGGGVGAWDGQLEETIGDLDDDGVGVGAFYDQSSPYGQ